MAITLSTVSTGSLGMQAAVLISVGVAMTVLVYGAVAVIVKADDGARRWRSRRGLRCASWGAASCRACRAS